MKVELLGPMSITDGIARHHVKSAKVRAALALLALNAEQVVSFDELVDELWAEGSVQNAKNSLHANIMRLRKEFEPHAPRGFRGQLVQTAGNGYLLDLPASSIDVNLFQSLACRGRRLVGQQPAEAISVLESALGLWRGPALVDAGNGLRCRASAASLEEQHIAAQEDLIAALLQVREERTAVARLKELVERYPTQERFYEQLMHALYLCGRRTEALEVFHRARQWLGSELGLRPSNSLQNTYQAILVQEPGLSVQRMLNAARAGLPQAVTT
jgi:SARP family transcriptional regulator, regulator of embCAB operon